MTKLDETDKHQEIVAKTIEEFKNRDDLLNSYSKKFSQITSDISDLESELIIWRKEKEDLQKNPANKEEVEIWQSEIDKIEDHIKDKEADLRNLQKKIDDLTIQNQDLREKIEIIETEHIEHVINKIPEYHELSDDESLDNYRVNLVSNLKLLKDLWKVQEKEYDLTKFVKFFKSKNIEIDFKLLNELFKESKGYFIPSIITKFLNEYLEDYDFKNIVDSNCQIGSLMFQLKYNDKSNLTAFLEKPEDEDVIKLIYSDKNIDFKTNLEELQEIPEIHFNIVLGVLDNNKNDQIDFDDITDNKEKINFLKITSKLNKNGVVLCIINPELRLNWGDTSVFTNLEKYGLHIDAVIRLASEIFPERDSDKTLLIIKKNKPKKVFIGELNYTSNDILLENIKKRKSGKIPQHGLLTDLKSFYSFQTFLAKYESQELGKLTELESVKISNILKKILTYPNFSEDIEDFNYLFLSRDQDFKPVLSSQNFDSDPKNYLQLFFDEKLALTEYLVHFFKTQLGKKIRESLDGTDFELFKKLLYETELYLPDLDGQINVINVDSLITELFTRADNYKRNLWKFPMKVSEIKYEIENTDGKVDQKIEKWIENLPFPLASIIWASLTVSDYSVKVKYLIDFFEAFSEFNCVLMLSGLSSDPNFFEEEYARCKRNIQPVTWYNKPTFGTWNFLGNCLSSTIRKLLKNQEKRSRCIELFGNPDPEFLERISNTEIKDLLLEVANYRNQWDAHGPRVSPEEYQNRYKIMEGALLRLYQLISDVYENSYLLIPGSSIFRDGIHNYTIKRLMGTRGPFRSDNIETITLMDSKKIYFFNNGQRKPVELLPFIHILNDNCYFYNSLYEREHENQGQLRYVSYHYSEEAEIPIEFEKLGKVFDLL